jgi:hypothetical protein
VTTVAVSKVPSHQPRKVRLVVALVVLFVELMTGATTCAHYTAQTT